MDVEYETSAGPPNPAEMLHYLGYFGHYLHVHAGGRGGKKFVLTALSKHDGHLTQRELLERSDVSSASLSEVLTKLEGEQLIRRSACQRDRRQLDIELTAKGHDWARHACEERERFESAAFSCLTIEEQRTLGTLLSRVKRHWTTLDESEAKI